MIHYPWKIHKPGGCHTIHGPWGKSCRMTHQPWRIHNQGIVVRPITHGEFIISDGVVQPFTHGEFITQQDVVRSMAHGLYLSYNPCPMGYKSCTTHAPWVETVSYDPCGMVSYGCRTAHGHWAFVTLYTPLPMGKKSLKGLIWWSQKNISCT